MGKHKNWWTALFQGLVTCCSNCSMGGSGSRDARMTSLADGKPGAGFAGVALDVATPVELAVAAFDFGDFECGVSSPATHRLTVVDVRTRAVADATARAPHRQVGIRLAIVRGALVENQVSFVNDFAPVVGPGRNCLQLAATSVRVLHLRKITANWTTRHTKSLSRV